MGVDPDFGRDLGPRAIGIGLPGEHVVGERDPRHLTGQASFDAQPDLFGVVDDGFDIRRAPEDHAEVPIDERNAAFELPHHVRGDELLGPQLCAHVVAKAEAHVEFGLMLKLKGEEEQAKKNFNIALNIYSDLQLQKEIEKIQLLLNDTG